MRLKLALLFATLLLGACANQGLRELSTLSPGPDEFIVEPRTEISMPDDLSSLPEPTPGQTNRTDADPVSEAVIALGGRPDDAAAPVPGADGALVTAASRFGVSPDIRRSLAAEDAEFRRKQGRLSQFQIFPEDLYFRAYADEALNAAAAAAAWRNRGVRIPSYPPSQ